MPAYHMAAQVRAIRALMDEMNAPLELEDGPLDLAERVRWAVLARGGAK